MITVEVDIDPGVYSVLDAIKNAPQLLVDAIWTDAPGAANQLTERMRRIYASKPQTGGPGSTTGKSLGTTIMSKPSVSAGQSITATILEGGYINPPPHWNIVEFGRRAGYSGYANLDAIGEWARSVGKVSMSYSEARSSRTKEGRKAYNTIRSLARAIAANTTRGLGSQAIGRRGANVIADLVRSRFPASLAGELAKNAMVKMAVVFSRQIVGLAPTPWGWRGARGRWAVGPGGFRGARAVGNY